MVVRVVGIDNRTNLIRRQLIRAVVVENILHAIVDFVTGIIYLDVCYGSTDIYGTLCGVSAVLGGYHYNNRTFGVVARRNQTVVVYGYPFIFVSLLYGPSHGFIVRVCGRDYRMKLYGSAITDGYRLFDGNA